jgi:uncharacterized membrane protein YbaN (DUF454 family)
MASPTATPPPDGPASEPQNDRARDDAEDLRLHASRAMRWLYWTLGTLFVALGAIGAVLPVMPTTPFLLVAAACYARASPRFYHALLGHRHFGPLIREWRRHHSIPWRVKLWAIALMSITLTTSIVFFVPNPWVKAGLAAMGVGLAVWLYRIPSRDRPR